MAVNGRPIEPTHSPHANAGDVITFQLRIQNRMVFPLFDIRNRLEWGTGLVYEGNMDRENMMGRFDDVENEISLSIAEIRPQREKIEYSCLFDLKVAGCEGLTVHVRPEEIYSRQKLQSHPVAVHMKSADILCEIATSHAKSDADGKTAVKVDIRNTGDDDASELLLDTDFEDIPVFDCQCCRSFPLRRKIWRVSAGRKAPSRPVPVFAVYCGKLRREQRPSGFAIACAFRSCF